MVQTMITQSIVEARPASLVWSHVIVASVRRQAECIKDASCHPPHRMTPQPNLPNLLFVFLPIFVVRYAAKACNISRWWQNAPARTHACQSRRVSSFRAIDDLFVRPGLDPVVLLLEHSLVTSATPSVMLMFHAARRGTGLRRPIPPECRLHQSL